MYSIGGFDLWLIKVIIQLKGKVDCILFVLDTGKLNLY